MATRTLSLVSACVIVSWSQTALQASEPDHAGNFLQEVRVEGSNAISRIVANPGVLRKVLVSRYGVKPSAFTGKDCPSVIDSLLADALRFKTMSGYRPGSDHSRLADTYRAIQNWCPTTLSWAEIFSLGKAAPLDINKHPVNAALVRFFDEVAVALDEHRSAVPLNIQAATDRRYEEERLAADAEHQEREHKEQQARERKVQEQKRKRAMAACVDSSEYQRHAAAGMLVRALFLEQPGVLEGFNAFRQQDDGPFVGSAIAGSETKLWFAWHQRHGGVFQDRDQLRQEARTLNPCHKFGVPNTLDDPTWRPDHYRSR